MFVIVTAHVGEERDARRQPVQLPIAQKAHVLVLGFDSFEWFERLEIWRVRILHRAAVVVGVFIFGCRIGFCLLVERKVQRQVGRIPRHRIFAFDAEVESRNREVAHGGFFLCISEDAVALLFCGAVVNGVA